MLAFGIDNDLGALEAGKQPAGNLHFTCALEERLPFGSNCFDFMICRVALPYMHIPTALREMGRTLKPEGVIWLSLHSFTFVRQELIANIRSLNLKGVLFRLYAIANGLLFHFFGEEYRFPLSRKRCESFQTRRSIERGLRAAGFEKIEVSLGERFIVTAVKRSSSQEEYSSLREKPSPT
jgi:ubiquinone/menaquinone biosynthesis C-methylase UbiE